MDTNKGIDWVSWAQRIILMLASIMIAYGMTQIAELRATQIEYGKDLAAIKSNRFTNKDGEAHLVMITRNETSVLGMKDDIKEIKQDQKEILAILHKAGN